MYIARVQIEEGFLDGLDIQLSSGLNVVIGARGTGKTSLIELIRFCLGVPGYTPDTTKRSWDHALSVLGTGQVTLTLADGVRTVTVSRTAHDDEPQASGPYSSPIVFSQTEIESVALHAGGRLKLLDSFAPDRRRSNDLETASIADVQSLSAEVDAVRSEIEELDRQLVELGPIEKQITDLAPKEQQLSQISTAAAEKKKILDALSVKIANNAVATSQAERLAQGIARWKNALLVANNSTPSVDSTLIGKDNKSITQVADTIRRVQQQVAQSVGELDTVERKVAEIVQTATKAKLDDEAKARALRKDIEALQSGAGAVVSAGHQLRERKAQLEAIRDLAKSRKKDLADLLTRRAAAQDRMDDVRQRRFEARQTAAKDLNSTLGPRIKIGVNRAGQFDIYASAIADILKGSGLRYGDLSSQIAETISPRELIDAADRNDVDALAQAASITVDRAARVLAQIRLSNLGALATVLVDDDVSLQLLDGKVYKPMNDLSTGQRCTVVLPIVLRHFDRMLIVDQPEDHIDNAFIADTLIKAILARSEQSQLLFSTHNANIPVLGNAERVIQLGSDGRRGFVMHEGQLEEPAIVNAITSVMEGGLEAFRRRAKFYEDNSLV